MEHEIIFPELPYYFTIVRKIDKENDRVTVVINSRIHVNKTIQMPNTWSVGFVQDRYRQFRSEILSFVVKRYGLRLEDPKYV